MTSQRVVFLWIALVSTTATIAFWQIQIPESGMLSDEKEAWQELNFTTTEEVDMTLATLKRLKPWGESEAVRGNQQGKTTNTTQADHDNKKQAISWRLVGIVQQGHQRHILLLDNATQKVSSHFLENALPGEVHLVAIHDDAIEIKQEGKIEIVRLYR